MTTSGSSGRRTLTEHLRHWSAPQVAGLLARRPDLLQRGAPADVAELAQRAQHQPSLIEAIAATTLPENRLLQLVVCCRPDVPMDELAAALPEGVGLDDVEPVLSSLEAAALLWRHHGRVHTSGTLRQVMPITLGPPVRTLLREQTVDYLKAALRLLRASAGEGGLAGNLPERATAPGGRPPRKAELIDELESLLVAPGLVGRVLASGPEACAGVAAGMARGRPVIAVDHPMYFSPYRTTGYHRHYPTYWLFERALLLPLGDGSTGVQPREVGMALRGGRPVADLALEAPALVTGTVDPGEVDGWAAARLHRTLDRLADLLDRWEGAPVKTLKTGGLGATVMKQTAAVLETDLEEAARLVELAHLAGLIDITTSTRKQGRAYVHESFVGPSPAAAAWAARPVPERGRQLAVAWMRAEHWPSASGRKPADDAAMAGTFAQGKAAPVLTSQRAASAPERRGDVLDALASLEAESATTPGALATWVYWRRPQPWLRLGGQDPATAVGWVHAEAELLGVAASGALSSFGRSLLSGDHAAAERALHAALPAPATTFTLQADLTATALGTLDRDVALELRLLADVESTGAATTFRFSDTSLRRAFDAGRGGDAILAFLEAHASKGVPNPLAYLVADVARRYGHLHVGSAGSFVTSDDPAVLADACSHRRTRKLGLRLLAPTVAVSRQPSATVMDGLRAAGFLPTAEGAPPGSVSISGARSAPPSVASGATPKGGSGGGLPERFCPRGGGGQRPTVPLDEATAARMAEAILAGKPSGRAPSTAQPPTPGTRSAVMTVVDALFDDEGRDDGGFEEGLFDDDGEAPYGPELIQSLEELVDRAYQGSRVLAISLAGPDDRAEPVLLAVTGVRSGQVTGVNLDGGALTSIRLDDIGATIDLGPVEEFDNLALLGQPRSRSRRRRSSRGRRR